MDTADVRRRITQALDRARQAGAERRERNAAAGKAYDVLLAAAIAIAHQVAGALKAEGHTFIVSTPAGCVRLSSERAAEDFVEISLDTSGSEPAVLGRVGRRHGRDAIVEERPVAPGKSVDAVGESDVLDFLADAVVPLVAR
jgi:hypothetical protein